MPAHHRCPKCAGQLYTDAAPGAGGPELVCLQCGWRRVLTLAEARVSAPTAAHQPRLHVARRQR